VIEVQVVSRPGTDPLVKFPAVRTLKRAFRKTVISVRRAASKGSRLPDFIVIGAQRAGTTSLFNVLSSHADVSPSVVKEVHFFDLNYEEGLDWYRSHFPSYPWKKYLNKHMWGEASPYYLFEPRVPQRVHESLPDVKLIVLLRNPIDRAYSDYQRQVLLGHEKLSFEEAIEIEMDRISGEVERLVREPTYKSLAYRRHAYLTRGVYSDQLERWLAYFPRDQIFISSAENFFRDGEQVVNGVTDFLGLPECNCSGLRNDNSVLYDPMLPDTRDRLRVTFADEKRRLEWMTGLTFDWDI
jgi:Sulfotransferase domain